MNRYIICLCRLACVCAALFVGLPAFAALEVTTQRTSGHIGVPGTNAYFVPSAGLVRASGFDGFESAQRRVEVIVAYIDAPMPEIRAGFTEASFKSRGMDLKSSGELTINGSSAILYKVLQDDGTTKWGKWIMLAENGPGTLVVNAAFVSGDAAAASDLERMLKGLYMEPTVPRPVQAVAPAESGGASGLTSADRTPIIQTNTGGGSQGVASADRGASFDKREALAILARDLVSSDDAVKPRSGDGTPRRGGARIITEDGVISGGDESDGEAGE